jgi:hypothetical protein
MASSTTVINGRLEDAQGNPIANEYIYFRLKQAGADNDVTPTTAYGRGAVEGITDSSGDVKASDGTSDFTVWVNGDSDIQSVYEVTAGNGRIEPTLVIVPTSASGGSIAIGELLINHVVSGSDTQQSTVLDEAKQYTDTELDAFAIDPATAQVNFNATNWIADLGLDADLPTFSVPANTTISTFGASLVDDANAAAANITLGIANGSGGGQVGSSAQSTSGGAVGKDTIVANGFAGGDSAAATTGGAIGSSAFATTGGAIGASAIATQSSAVQLGAGTNSTASTVQFLSSGSITASQFGKLSDFGDKDTETTITDDDTKIPTSGAVVDYMAQETSVTQVIVKQASDLSGTLDSTKVYYIDGIIDMGSQTIEVPSGGLSIIGSTFDVSQLTSSSNSYDMFTSPVGGSGNLVLKDVGLTASGTSSSIFALTDATGFNAIEIEAVNFNNCTSLGYLDGYRQGLESGTGRFGGTPELEFRNTWVGGYRTDTTIARAMSNFTSLFKAGTGFTFAGRVILGMNCDLPATGAFCDFAASNIDNDESLQLADCRMTRSGTLDASDTTIYPNIDHTNVKCLWSDNAGLPNTTKYIKGNITTEVATTISATSTYYPLEGTFTIETSSHMDMPSNGEFRLLSGNGTYQIVGDLVLDAAANDVLDVRVTKSTDDGATWPTEITHIRRQVNSLVGGRDVAFFPINFIATLQEDDRVRLEVENTTTTSNVTAELDSYFIVTAL